MIQTMPSRHLSEEGVKSALRVLYFMPFAVFMLLVAGFTGGLMSAVDAPAGAFISAQSLEGEDVPVFSLESLDDDKPFTHEELKKKRFTLVNVFASWCVSCLEEHELLLEMMDRRVVSIYGLNWRDEKKSAQAWLERYGNPYENVGIDREGEVAIQFGITGAPETFLIGPGGKIVYRYPGVLTREILENEILPRIRGRR